MKGLARRKFLSTAIKAGALLPVMNLPATLLYGNPQEKPSDSALPVEYLPTALPDRIILTVTGSPATIITMNWRTMESTSVGMVEYGLADARPKFTAITQLKAQSRTFSFEKIRPVHHRITVDHLKANRYICTM